MYEQATTQTFIYPDCCIALSKSKGRRFNKEESQQTGVKSAEILALRQGVLSPGFC